MIHILPLSTDKRIGIFMLAVIGNSYLPYRLLS